MAGTKTTALFTQCL